MDESKIPRGRKGRKREGGGGRGFLLMESFAILGSSAFYINKPYDSVLRSFLFCKGTRAHTFEGGIIFLSSHFSIC